MNVWQVPLLTVGRIVLGTVGGLLIYSALFLYETEEGRIENLLEKWWSRVRALHLGAMSLQAAFLKVVADVTAKGFARLFGERLLGLKAFIASTCYSISSVMGATLWALCAIKVYRPRIYEYMVPGLGGLSVIPLMGIACAVFLLLGSLGPLVRRPPLKIAWLIVVGIAVSVFAAEVKEHPGDLVDPYLVGIGFITILPLAILSDFLFIAFTRFTLLRAGQSQSLIGLTWYFMLAGFLGLVLYFLPYFAAWGVFRVNPQATTVWLFQSAFWVGLICSTRWLLLRGFWLPPSCFFNGFCGQLLSVQYSCCIATRF